MIGFATFDSFISPGILVIGYYLGAVAMPFAGAVPWIRLRHRAPALMAFVTGGRDLSDRVLTRRQRLWLFLIAALAFLFAQIVWRMMFETMIAYFQMRDALMTLVP